MSYGVLILVGVLASIGVPSVGTGEVTWGPNRLIGWEDFQGAPPVHAESMAQAAEIHMSIRCHLELVIEYDCQQCLWKAAIDRDSLVVTNTMDPSLSFVAPGKKSQTILNHEQRHFDLNEVYRRVLLAALSTLAGQGVDAELAKQAVQQSIDATTEKILAQLAKIQDRYDKETPHGRDLQGQAAWDTTIDAWLADPEKAP